MSIGDDILAYYNLGDEPERLHRGFSQLEALRTKEIILRFIEREGLKILDIGGGAGYYSQWLAELGHQVELVDPIALHIEKARERSKKSSKPLHSISLGEARQLKFESDYFDMVLMLGPLYHLTERRDRLDALYEAERVLDDHGVIVCGAISRFASTFDGFFRDFIVDPAFITIMDRDLLDGQHRNPTGRAEYFTTAFFHHPEDLREEVRQGGFRLEALLSVEGFGWLMPDFEKKWENEKFRGILLEKIRTVEADPSIMGIAAHMIAVGRKIL
jgi:ubiquinone/menaquinone biosynthesis C-methylase UbiE